MTDAAVTVPEKAIRALLLLCVAVGSISTLGGVSTVQKLACLVVLALGLALACLSSDRVRLSAPGVLLIGYMALLTVALLRFAANPLQGTSGAPYVLAGLALILLAAFVLVAMATCPPEHFQGRLTAVALAPGLFLAINIVLLLGGVDYTGRAPDDVGSGPATLLAHFGITINRGTLPLIVGLNGAGTVGAVALVTGAVFVATAPQRRLRRAGCASAVLGLAVVLITDSRGPLLFAVVTLVLVAAVPKWSRRSLRLLPIALPLAPVLITRGLAELGSSAGTFSRSGTDALTATGRTEVWAVAARFLSHFDANQLVGYGAYGQARTGLSAQYAHIFTADNRLLASLHNAVLQNILDMGYIGAAVFLALLGTAISNAIRTYEETHSAAALAVFASLLLIGFLGATEAIPSVSSLGILASFVAASAAASRTIDGEVRTHAILALGRRRASAGVVQGLAWASGGAMALLLVSQLRF